MVYMDWAKAETDRIVAQVAQETDNGQLFISRRCMRCMADIQGRVE